MKLIIPTTIEGWYEMLDSLQREFGKMPKEVWVPWPEVSNLTRLLRESGKPVYGEDRAHPNVYIIPSAVLVLEVVGP